ncbi:unnamed protein product [Phaeothamnion confervicola]
MGEGVDESVQTAQDYTVEVFDPQDDADDPQEWADFFGQQFGKVCYVTIARNNGPLLALLFQRRQLADTYRLLGFSRAAARVRDLLDGRTAPPGVLLSLAQRLGVRRDEDYWLMHLVLTTVKINRMLRAGNFPVTKVSSNDGFYGHSGVVFVVFEAEEGQRRALKSLTTGYIPAALDLPGLVRDDHRFRGRNVLNIGEAVEPSEVVWQNLDIGPGYRLLQQALTVLLTLGVVTAAFFAISALDDSSSTYAAFGASALSSGLPGVIKALVRIEKHVDASDQQESLVLKLLAARLATTAIIIFLTTEWYTWLHEDSLSAVQTILLSDALLDPTVKLLNIEGLIRKHWSAPAAPTQEAANAYMEGVVWNLGERYTDMIKTLFLSMFYAALVPTGLFISASAFLGNYFVDRYMLLRNWQVPPQLDASLAKQLRPAIMFAVLGHLVVTRLWYYSW